MTISITQINHMESYVQFAGYQFGNQHILFVRTGPRQGAGGVLPVDHVNGNNLIALLFEQESGDARINAA